MRAKSRQRGRPPHPDVLTPAEWRVVNAVRHGMSNPQISKRLHVSLDAVKFHVANAVEKLGLRNRTALKHWSGAPIDGALKKGHAMTTVAAPSSTIGSVGQISRMVRDIPRAVEWYRDVLGLPESEVTEGELETPNVTLSFWEPKREDLPFVDNEAGFAVRVADVADARAELEAMGVEFIAETWDSGVCHFAAFRDPDGNTVILHRRYASKAPRRRP